MGGTLIGKRRHMDGADQSEPHIALSVSRGEERNPQGFQIPGLVKRRYNVSQQEIAGLKVSRIGVGWGEGAVYVHLTDFL